MSPLFQMANAHWAFPPNVWGTRTSSPVMAKFEMQIAEEENTKNKAMGHSLGHPTVMVKPGGLLYTTFSPKPAHTKMEKYYGGGQGISERRLDLG